jgi:hypothetical protein
MARTRSKTRLKARQQADLGPRGQASLRRPSAIVQAPEATAGVLVRRFADVTLIDRVWSSGWLGTGEEARIRHEAALALRELHHSAGLTPQCIAAYQVSTGGSDEMSDREAEARARYNRVLRALGTYADTAQDLAVYDHQPGMARRVHGLRALDLVAGELGIASVSKCS